ncbi:Glycolate oxidase subunit GlcF, (4Fe-4S) protein (plasmid) [Pseudorhizobium banfieldiae]|uniref:Glycolate oxidase iron-sulfur subunit n=1 Tax=Pseudorhizobium banfieldiae TaxID=1125847 RepID=L0NN71_9HYPH|nr:glycolate oxidase subunit GlcF [Pseudorhizobium banfieldiae]CAD6629010.1 glycolate oxidase iron-sulfur subunit [arsenite-oxidising bacterium NT-25]CCF22276.1 Glycolate oxidase subunit GlcF, (4Fe-4S) protein [Pseudorhizobium banfieldiae]
MQTTFTPEQLRDPAIERSNEVLRSCVHCGFCTATCPTYQVLGDELDSPRGRIYLIKDMLENDRPADAATVKHIDRCLGCLSCMSTCPSGVHYGHLVDHARTHIEKTYRRPLRDRWLRRVLVMILPYPGRFRMALRLAKIARPMRKLIPDERLRAMLDMAPAKVAAPSPFDAPQTHKAIGQRRKRVVMMTGCAQRALDPEINAATLRLLTRLGVEVVIPKGEGCCGALVHHMGREEETHGFAARNIRAWTDVINGTGLDGIVINTSGCGTTVKDYGYIFRNSDMAADAARVSALAMDITEFLTTLDLHEAKAEPLRVAYHAACSLQHGQKVTADPKQLLTRAGFQVLSPKDPHLCCGSAGTYNLLQPKIANELKSRKVRALMATHPDVISAGNIGCMMQIGSAAGVPVVHTVQLLDWAYGGPKPAALDNPNQIKRGA